MEIQVKPSISDNPYKTLEKDRHPDSLLLLRRPHPRQNKHLSCLQTNAAPQNISKGRIFPSNTGTPIPICSRFLPLLLRCYLSLLLSRIASCWSCWARLDGFRIGIAEEGAFWWCLWCYDGAQGAGSGEGSWVWDDGACPACQGCSEGESFHACVMLVVADLEVSILVCVVKMFALAI